MVLYIGIPIAYSQEEPDKVEDLFLSVNFIYGFVGALGILVPAAMGIAWWLKRSVNSSYEKNKNETKEQIEDLQKVVSSEIVALTNNVNSKANDTKENIMEIKKSVGNIEDKLVKSSNDNIENRTRLNEVERRVSVLEYNKHSSSPMGSMGMQ